MPELIQSTIISSPFDEPGRHRRFGEKRRPRACSMPISTSRKGPSLALATGVPA